MIAVMLTAAVFLIMLVIAMGIKIVMNFRKEELARRRWTIYNRNINDMSVTQLADVIVDKSAPLSIKMYADRLLRIQFSIKHRILEPINENNEKRTSRTNGQRHSDERVGRERHEIHAPSKA